MTGNSCPAGWIGTPDNQAPGTHRDLMDLTLSSCTVLASNDVITFDGQGKCRGACNAKTVLRVQRKRRHAVLQQKSGCLSEFVSPLSALPEPGVTDPIPHTVTGLPRPLLN